MNVALRLAALGIDTQLLSRVGDDAPGRDLLAYIESHGLTTRYVQIDPRHRTGSVNVDTSDRHAVRYHIETPSAWDFIDAGEFAAAPGSVIETVVFGSLAARGTISRRSLLDILDCASLSVFDINLRPPYDSRETVEDLLARSDWVKLNETEVALVADWCGNAADCEAALPAIADRYELDVVCVTCGGDGAILYQDGTLIRQPAFAVDVVDTIGCGDAFLGTWLAGMLAGTDADEALCRACAVGAIVAANAGANPCIPEGMIHELTGRN